jgi:hypothetical protein
VTWNVIASVPEWLPDCARAPATPEGCGSSASETTTSERYKLATADGFSAGHVPDSPPPQTTAKYTVLLSIPVKLNAFPGAAQESNEP